MKFLSCEGQITIPIRNRSSVLGWYGLTAAILATHCTIPEEVYTDLDSALVAPLPTLNNMYEHSPNGNLVLESEASSGKPQQLLCQRGKASSKVIESPVHSSPDLVPVRKDKGRVIVLGSDDEFCDEDNFPYFSYDNDTPLPDVLSLFRDDDAEAGEDAAGPSTGQCRKCRTSTNLGKDSLKRLKGTHGMIPFYTICAAS